MIYKTNNNLKYALNIVSVLLLLLSAYCILTVLLSTYNTPDGGSVPISPTDTVSASDVVSDCDVEPEPEPDNISDGNYTDEQMAYLVEYFSDSMFVGDSVLLGFKNYARKYDPPALEKTFFYGAVGYAAIDACAAVSESSKHPTYGGTQTQPYYVARYRGIKKVFLVFGHNDLTGFPVETIVKHYNKLISRFKRECPDIEVYIISPIYVYKGTDNYELNNENIYLLNFALMEYCENDENGYGAKFVDVASYTGNSEDGIDAIFSSDKYCHVNEAAYEIWVRCLCDYALGLETPLDAFDEQKQLLWEEYNSR